MGFLTDFFFLFFPRVCLACGKNLFTHEEYVCSVCLFQLPKTNFHQEEDNPVSRLFWGRAVVENASAFYYYVKGGKVQRLIHQLKYKGEQGVGEYLGLQYGKKLAETSSFQDISMVIPVPLHPRKLKKRGYNQAEAIARGVAEGLKVTMNNLVLIRNTANETQTRKSKYNRWQNVDGIFTITNPNFIMHQHILLIDDVITTGATLEACIQALHQVGDVKVSVAAIAAAVQ